MSEHKHPHEPEMEAAPAPDFVSEENPNPDTTVIDAGPDELADAAEPPDLNKELANADAPSMEGLVTFLGIPLDVLNKLVIEKLSSEGSLRFINEVREAGTYDNLLYFAIDATADEVLRSSKFLSTFESDKFDTRLLSEDGKKVILGVSAVNPAPRAGGRPPMVSGAEGIVKMLGARKGNVRRIPLYNSGFSIDIRVPTVDEISTLIRRCRLDKMEYESQLGAPFYMFYDRLLKVNFIEFLEKLIVFSTCNNYHKEGVLLSAIKLPDYQALLAHVAAMMYPKGYENFRVFCTRPRSEEYPNGCNHVEEITVGVEKLVRTRFAVLSPDAISHMCRARIPTNKITTEQLDEYQAMLGFTKTFDYDEYRFTLDVPSMAAHLEAASVFNTELLNEVQGSNTAGILSAIQPRELRMLSQYIKSVDTLDEFGEVAVTSEDQTVITYILDLLFERADVEEKLIKPIRAFVNESQLTYICYPTFECPKCGHHPDTPSGFFSLDPQNAFFTIALLKSIRGS